MKIEENNREQTKINEEEKAKKGKKNKMNLMNQRK